MAQLSSSGGRTVPARFDTKRRWALTLLAGMLAVLVFSWPAQQRAGAVPRQPSSSSLLELSLLQADVRRLEQTVEQLQQAMVKLANSSTDAQAALAHASLQRTGGGSGAPMQGGPGCPAGRERVLVVVLAQTRAHALTWPLWESNFWHNLTPDEPGCADLALCVGQEEDTTTNPFYQHAKHVWKYPEVEDWGTAYDDAAAQLNSTANWRQVLCVPEQFMGGIHDPKCEHPGSSGILIFFRWFLVRSLNASGAIDQYDRFIVTRSDYMHKMLHAPLSVLPPEYIWIPDGERYNGVTDRHIILPRRHVTAALDFLTEMVTDPEGYVKKLKAFTAAFNLEAFIHVRRGDASSSRGSFHPAWLPCVVAPLLLPARSARCRGTKSCEHHQNLPPATRASEFNLLDRRLWPLVRFFPYTMFTVRGASDKTRWSQGQYNEEEGLTIKYPPEYESYKNWSKTLKTNEDWAAYMVTRNLSTELR